MGWYRLYFLGRHGDIRNVDEFNVTADEQALMLADSLHDAVSDIYPGYELWQNSRRLFRHANSAAVHPFVAEQTITVDMQSSLLKREEVLHASDTAFARSQRLLERMREVRDVVRAPRLQSRIPQ
jgi:hypothetical protein